MRCDLALKCVQIHYYIFVKANLFRILEAPLPVRRAVIGFMPELVLFYFIFIFFVQIQFFVSCPQREYNYSY